MVRMEQNQGLYRKKFELNIGGWSAMSFCEQRAGTLNQNNKPNLRIWIDQFEFMI